MTRDHATIATVVARPTQDTHTSILKPFAQKFRRPAAGVLHQDQRR
jgi:hypothetical protein